MRFVILAFVVFAGCTRPNDAFVADTSSTAVDMARSSALDLASGDLSLAPSADHDMAQAQLDMATAGVVDLALPECGKESGEACCAGACAPRDSQSRFLVCHSDSCQLCGTQGALCCANSTCFGGTSCAPQGSAFAGTCR